MCGSDPTPVCSPYSPSTCWGLFKVFWDPSMVARSSGHGSVAGICVLGQICSGAFQSLRKRAVYRHAFSKLYFYLFIFLNLYVPSVHEVSTFGFGV